MEGASIAANFSNVRVEKEHVGMVGGENATESEVSRVKSQLRRTNLLGRGSPKSCHVHVLASRRVLAKPGLAAVLEALRMVRDARMGKMGCNPASFSRSTRTLLGCSSEQGDLSNCRNLTGAHSLAPNQARRGPLRWNNFFEKLPQKCYTCQQI